MGDWMISKKRYWGLSLPIWVDDADPTQFEVIGSREELRERAVEGWAEFDGHTPHRPWVDKIKIRNPRTGNLMSRIPDVGNPWLDAGIVAFSTMKYNTDRAYWDKWYPADFITESFPGQFRNWFYALLALSTMMSDGKPPFKTLLGHGLVRDEVGKEMHKSAGNSIEFNSAAEDMGADAMRWLYCRANPASNLNFGPGPINDVRAKFVIKLWNCYGFFCNYARLDGFDPSAAQVPAKDRPDIDRWILSDLQLLVKTARESFEAFDVMSFCLAAEEFIDAKLSNWYIRVNRPRFWSKNAELDATGLQGKRAAYQTLHTVLLTLCKLCAPVVPFLTESMWANLRGGAESVHLTDYPTADESLIDNALSQDMDAVLRVVSLGMAARNKVEINVRRPLAELRVAGSAADTRAVGRFPDLITDELNLKRVTLMDEGGPLLTDAAKLNPKTAKARYKGKPDAAVAALALLDAAKVREELKANGKFTLLGVELSPDDVLFETTAPDGWAGYVDKGTQVLIDIRITPELKAEGMARDIVRSVQNARKDAGLDVADKIVLHLGTASAELHAAINTHRATIAAETQAVRWEEVQGGHTAAVKVDGQELVIALQKA
jgi:isoleucyl-tRNA synthetase